MADQVDGSLQEISNLLGRAQQGDVTALPALRAFLDARPEVWRTAGDLAAHAQQSLLRLIAGNDLLGREAITRQLVTLKTQLAGSAPTPLEELLVERIGLCWLAVHFAEIDAADARTRDQGPISLYAVRRLDGAHKRYLQSLRALAVVRRLLKPSQRPAPRKGRPSNANHGQNGTVREPVALVHP